MLCKLRRKSNFFFIKFKQFFFLLGYEDEEVPVVQEAGRDYLESPMMTDGTIEEDFETALAKEVAAVKQLGSPDTPMIETNAFEGR